jgi:diaminohydroxyphosphoribosylaminopyrimidine deaminase/5-amino-6-(5-phosphoribosylamino)uracil reductase
MAAQRPFVRMKIAASLDGRTALNNGVSQWITGPEARQDGHRWRAQADAILTGAGTLRSDDPMLNVRGVEVARQPMLVIVDSRLETPPSARLFGEKRPVLIYAAQPAPARQQALEAAGATVVYQPGAANDKGPKVDLAAMMTDLYQRGVGSIHTEAGAALNGSLLQAALVDELLVYLAPMLIGPGAPMAGLPALENLESSAHWRFAEVATVGNDLRCRLRNDPAN